MNVMTEIPKPKEAKPTQSIDTYYARNLVKDGVQARIILDDKTYYLRITRAGKLILTK